MYGVIPLQVQGFVLLFTEFHEVLVSPFVLAVEVAQDSNITLCCISHSSLFCVIRKLAEGTLYPTVQIINESVKQDQTQH